MAEIKESEYQGKINSLKSDIDKALQLLSIGDTEQAQQVLSSASEMAHWILWDIPKKGGKK